MNLFQFIFLCGPCGPTIFLFYNILSQNAHKVRKKRTCNSLSRALHSFILPLIVKGILRRFYDIVSISRYKVKSSMLPPYSNLQFYLISRRFWVHLIWKFSFIFKPFFIPYHLNTWKITFYYNHLIYGDTAWIST